MRLRFLNREKELGRLGALLASGEGSLGVLYGRRRCGKSRLLQEALKGRPAIYFVGDEREPALQRAALARAVAPVLPGFGDVGYPDWASLLERWWREAPFGTALVLDEFPYLARAGSELPSVLQRLVDAEPKRLHLLLCGSSQRMMQGLVLDASAPLYGRAREILRVGPLEAGWTGRALRLSRTVDALEAFSVWGGTPRYWELAADFDSTWTAIERLALDPLGVLYREPERLLLDDVRETSQAASLLALIGQGCHRLSEIAARLGKPATSLTRPLQRLLELGLVRREQPFGADARRSKKSLYRIDDPFLAFWFRFVDPNRSLLEAGGARSVARAIAKSFPHHFAAVWEDLARRSTSRFRIAGTDWRPAGRWWGGGKDGRPLEVDVVAESEDGKSLLLGEVKSAPDARKLDGALRDLERKAALFPMAADYRHVHVRVFVADDARLTSGQKRQVVTGRRVLSAMK